MPSETEKALDCLQSWWEASLPVHLVVTTEPRMELRGGKLVSVSKEKLEFHWAHSIPEISPFIYGWGNNTVELADLSLSISGSSAYSLASDPVSVSITKGNQVYCKV